MLKVMHAPKIVAIFALVLFTGLFLAPAHAEPSTGDMGAEVYVDSSLTFDISPREVVLDLNSANHPFDAKDTLNIVVGTNNTTGYELVMSSNTTYLTTTTSNAKIPTLPTLDGGYTKDTFPDNTWGYRKDGGNYMPFESGKPIMESSTAADRDTTTLGFAAKVNGSQLAGAYAINLNFEVVIRPLPETHTMQNLDPTLCTTTPSTVIDSRDGEEYTIKRLEDGKCWLLENLRLDISDPAVQANLTSATTNATDISLGYLKNGGGLSPYPVNGVVAKGWSDDWVGSNDTPYIFTSYKNRAPAYYWDSIGARKAGIYYNFCAASAGSRCVDLMYYDSNQDVCPAGWRMPTGGPRGEYAQLLGLYRLLYDSDGRFQTELSTPFSGRFSRGLYGYNEYGTFWSSTAMSDHGRMYFLYVDGTIDEYGGTVSPEEYLGAVSDNGLSVRCVLK